VGYTAAVDWWSLGVTIYRLLTCSYPFDIQPDSDIDITDPPLNSCYFRIEDIDFSQLSKVPEYSDGIDFISGLLASDETERLGYSDTGSIDVASHEYFKHIGWVQLEMKTISPPELSISYDKLKPLSGDHKAESLETFLMHNGKSNWLKFGSAKSPSLSASREESLQKHFTGWYYSSPETIAAEIGSAKRNETLNVV